LRTEAGNRGLERGRVGDHTKLKLVGGEEEIRGRQAEPVRRQAQAGGVPTEGEKWHRKQKQQGGGRIRVSRQGKKTFSKD